MPDITAGQPASTPVHREIANLVVRLTNEYTGRGPTKARATITDSMVTVLLEDVLTRGERSLVRSGRTDEVLRTRHVYQETMRNDLVAGVEMLLQRPVTAFMSANHVDPDVGVEIFVLGAGPDRRVDMAEAYQAWDSLCTSG